MCGIVGYIGSREAVGVLMEGLARLSYRGYDSAGIAVMNPLGKIEVRKAKGKLEQLQKRLDAGMLEGTMGIGHTRWATHGEPSDLNAHPHTDVKGGIAVVHNGILENHEMLRKHLQKKGVVFHSETDTEVIVHMLHERYHGNMLDTLRETLPLFEGSYALGVMCDQEPDKLFCVRRDSPLVIGLRNGEGFLASDIPALLKYTRDVVFLKDHEIGVLAPEGLHVYDAEGQKAQYDFIHIAWEEKAAEKDGYAHFMLKEMHEQPKALQKTIGNRLTNPGWLPISKTEAEAIKKITIVGCGTAYHAGLYGKYVMEQLLRLPVAVEYASEYRYRGVPADEHELIIAISQSGETADTLAAVRQAQKQGANVLAICNVVGSSLVRELGEEKTLYTYAGPEIAVASTKAYLTQIMTLILFALTLGKLRECIGKAQCEQLQAKISLLPQQAEKTLENAPRIERLANRCSGKKHVFFVGRGLDYALSLEAALKLKELSYLCGEAYAAGELKHGPLALIEPGKLVVASITQPDLLEKTRNNLQEALTRGAQIIAVVQEDMQDGFSQIAEEILTVPSTHPVLAPLLAAIPMQMFAYYMAVERGCDVDQPRNLAKSVTVE